MERAGGIRERRNKGERVSEGSDTSRTRGDPPRPSQGAAESSGERQKDLASTCPSRRPEERSAAPCHSRCPLRAAHRVPGGLGAGTHTQNLSGREPEALPFADGERAAHSVGKVTVQVRTGLLTATGEESAAALPKTRVQICPSRMTRAHFAADLKYAHYSWCKCGPPSK